MPITLTESQYAARMYDLAKKEGHVKERALNLNRYFGTLDGDSSSKMTIILEEDIIELLDNEGPKTVMQIAKVYGFSESAIRNRLALMERRGIVERIVTKGPMKFRATLWD